MTTTQPPPPALTMAELAALNALNVRRAYGLATTGHGSMCRIGLGPCKRCDAECDAQNELQHVVAALPSLLAMARRLLELEGALEHLARHEYEVYWHGTYHAQQGHAFPSEPNEFRTAAPNVIDAHLKLSQKLGWRPEGGASHFGEVTC